MSGAFWFVTILISLKINIFAWLKWFLKGTDSKKRKKQHKVYIFEINSEKKSFSITFHLFSEWPLYIQYKY